MYKALFAAAAMMSCATAGYAADLPLKAMPATTAPVPWVDVFGGVAVVPDAYFGDAGAVAALHGSLARDGFLIRIHGGAGHYTYNRTATLEQGVSFQSGEVMVGYQTFLGAARVSAFLGPGVEHHDNPDPLATITGTKWGLKAQAEIFAPLGDRFYLFGLGTYSTAWSSYFVIGKVGYRLAPGIAVGPEVTALGNDRFDAVRAGPFVAFDVGQATQLILSGGYSLDTRRDDLNDSSGGYGTVHVRTTF